MAQIGVAYPRPVYIPILPIFNPAYFPTRESVTTTGGGGGGSQTNIFPLGLSSGNLIVLDGGTSAGTGSERGIDGLSVINMTDITQTTPSIYTGLIQLDTGVLTIGNPTPSTGIAIELQGSSLLFNGSPISGNGDVLAAGNNTFTGDNIFQGTTDFQNDVNTDSAIGINIGTLNLYQDPNTGGLVTNSNGITLNNSTNSNYVLLNSGTGTNGILNVANQVQVQAQTYPNTTDTNYLATIGFVNDAVSGIVAGDVFTNTLNTFTNKNTFTGDYALNIQNYDDSQVIGSLTFEPTTTINNSVLIGNYVGQAISSLNYIVSLGYNSSYNTNTNSYGISIGYRSDLGNSFSNNIVIGSNSLAGQSQAITIGGNSTASGISSISLGYQSSASATNSCSIGYNAMATAVNSYSIGTSANNTTQNSILLGAVDNTGGSSVVRIGNGVLNLTPILSTSLSSVSNTAGNQIIDVFSKNINVTDGVYLNRMTQRNKAYGYANSNTFSPINITFTWKAPYTSIQTNSMITIHLNASFVGSSNDSGIASVGFMISGGMVSLNLSQIMVNLQTTGFSSTDTSINGIVFTGMADIGMVRTLGNNNNNNIVFGQSTISVGSITYSQSTSIGSCVITIVASPSGTGFLTYGANAVAELKSDAGFTDSAGNPINYSCGFS